VLDAYMNFLMGKGSGTGWDLAHETEIAASLIHRDVPVLFDVGANIGDWSKGMLARVPRARIFLFEPAPACQERIRSLNLPNALLIPNAVGERPGKTLLHFSSSLDGSASLHARGDSYFRGLDYKAMEVEVVTLDQVMEQHGIEFVDFVKMDIEGHEFSALQGAGQSLKARRIGALSFEFGSGNINSRTFFRDFWNLLTSYNFKLWRVTPAGRLLPIEDYYEDCEYFRGVSNYIAQPTNRLEF
jgi:FkbM family methyltransferase